MSSYRPRFIASSLLLLTALVGFFLGAVSRPEPANAAGNGQRRFVFGPVSAPPGAQVAFEYFNSGALPTPAASYELRYAINGAPFGAPVVLESTGPGSGRVLGTCCFGERTDVVAIVTFDRPRAGQAIPSPFPGTFQVLSGDFVQAVVEPAH